MDLAVIAHICIIVVAIWGSILSTSSFVFIQRLCKSRGTCRKSDMMQFITAFGSTAISIALLCSSSIEEHIGPILAVFFVMMLMFYHITERQWRDRKAIRKLTLS